MNARIDIELCREAQEAAHADRVSKRRAAELAVECEVATELQSLFARGFAGEAVLLPIVRGTKLSTETFQDAVWESLNPINKEGAMDCLLAACRPTANPALALASMRAAIVDAYIHENGDDIARVRVAQAEGDAADIQAIEFWASAA